MTTVARVVLRNGDFGILCGIAWLVVYICPFNKVEESFNTQALHDFLYVFPRISHFDHLEFPGVVPRTFLGPLLIAAITWPLRLLFENKLLVLMLARCVFAAGSCGCLTFSLRQVKRVYGTMAWGLAVATMATQFHLMFYSSRFLPNSFALGLVTVALGYMIRREPGKVITLLTIAATVFRFEVALILLFYLLETREIRGHLPRVIASLAASLAVIVPIDSILWKRWTWAEWSVFMFNGIRNKSADYGTSPWHWYFSSAIPGSFTTLLPFCLSGLLSKNLSSVSRPFLGLLYALSILPHKELRFIFPLLPLLSISAAVSLSGWLARAGPGKSKVVLVSLIFGAQIGSFAGRLLLSSHNYPAGLALTEIHSHLPETRRIRIHIDTYCAMSGPSRFLYQNPKWRYDKREKLTGRAFLRFTHLLTGSPERHLASFKVIRTWRGFHRIRCRPSLDPLVLPCCVEFAPKVYLMARK